MLYLSRKLGQTVWINQSVEVKVVDVKGKHVTLGFTFPEGDTVLRGEVFDRVCQENQAAIIGNPVDDGESA